ncbi:hypothetical protein NEPAR06_1398 [Nematocida parisii]|uniref:CHY-type domain-containing protein n=1 Tax=Nematocida parisii (strain ERTm3) TaxID=935791 RepID=I3EKE1_NEMP3|nr:uncharacterized protein NEPG_00777 [Nematocida parisii ERTm1]EIJ89688.1 hypothetical protein NEQG_00458 [Nematocida parisii ERTm3]KAI5126857.1 hypothetical protein NEPAR03_0688 [Nematocida parisii]EIJ94110.1 hypothetical protein NEPG_00777 [Nematocida parisii ERTm1]KAI5126937.1 hypothetical protein NEPAR08_0687 [Nematocida parisii]KAI5141047.1 hypothetical protein NEPAR04_0685 [Nematocida parisii]|eukprot:XP_013058606.1 hypothetical protein NEPG_00777 [Nematocida parisii ERTm1]
MWSEGTINDRNLHEPPETVTGTYLISDKDFPYDIDKIQFRYSYRKDTISILNINNRAIELNVSVGYIRLRDRMTYKEYAEMVFQQIESILSGKPVVELEISRKEKVIEPLDLADTPIREGNYISFEYTAKHILAFKANMVCLSIFCKRCSTLNIKTIGGDGLDIKKNTKTRFNCIKCTVQMSIDSTFHLILPSGENSKNLMRIECTGIYNVSIRALSVNCVCSECSTAHLIELNKKLPCGCGCLLEIAQDKSMPFKEVICRAASTAKMPAKGDVPSLLKTGGTCAHYKKSSRIFIFPCCNTRYACDICHNKHESHPAVLATRMICGKCGIEGPVSPVCGSSVCKASLTGKSSAFWEGGKGSRNKVTMSRKDSKKYSR